MLIILLLFSVRDRDFVMLQKYNNISLENIKKHIIACQITDVI